MLSSLLSLLVLVSASAALPQHGAARVPLRGRVSTIDGATWSTAKVMLWAMPLRSRTGGLRDEIIVDVDARGRFVTKILPSRIYSAVAYESTDGGMRRSAVLQEVLYGDTVTLRERSGVARPHELTIRGSAREAKAREAKQALDLSKLSVRALALTANRHVIDATHVEGPRYRFPASPLPILSIEVRDPRGRLLIKHPRPSRLAHAALDALPATLAIGKRHEVAVLGHDGKPRACSVEIAFPDIAIPQLFRRAISNHLGSEPVRVDSSADGRLSIWDSAASSFVIASEGQRASAIDGATEPRQIKLVACKRTKIRVLWPDDTPAAGVRVHVVDPHPAMDAKKRHKFAFRRGVRSLVTDADGRASWTSRRIAAIRIDLARAPARGSAPAALRALFRDLTVDRTPIAVLSQAEARADKEHVVRLGTLAPFRLQFEGQDARPAHGVVFYARPADLNADGPEDAFEAVCDRRGRVSFLAPSRAWRFAAVLSRDNTVARGHMRVAKDASWQRQRLVPMPRVQLHARVAGSGKLMPDACIRADDGGHYSHECLFVHEAYRWNRNALSDVTSASGSFAIDLWPVESSMMLVCRMMRRTQRGRKAGTRFKIDLQELPEVPLDVPVRR